MISARLGGQLKNCYKIKLRQSGYRLVYNVDNSKVIVYHYYKVDSQ